MASETIGSLELHREAERMMDGADRANAAGDLLHEALYCRVGSMFEWAAMVQVEETHPERKRTRDILATSHTALLKRAVACELQMEDEAKAREVAYLAALDPTP